MPNSLFEAHLNVHDLEVLIAFYRDVVGLELAYVHRERPVRSSGSAGGVTPCSGCGQDPHRPMSCGCMWPFAWTLMPCSPPLRSCKPPVSSRWISMAGSHASLR